MEPAARRVVIFGTGLLGASVGLAARRAGAATIVGVDSSEAHRHAAKAANAIDVALDPQQDLQTVDDDVIVLATPVSAASAVMPRLAGLRGVVTDTLSTKSTICRLAEVHGLVGRFCGAHPMAGSERGGPAAATATLFDEATCFVCPGAAAPATVGRIEAFWRALGCGAIVPMAPDAHDALVARVSHVPHVVAAALASACGDDLPRGGSGVRDATRIAAGDPKLWADILLDNADHVAAEAERLSGELSALIDAIRERERSEVTRLLSRAARARASVTG